MTSVSDTVSGFIAENPDLEVIEVAVTDLNGVLRGKWIPVEKLPSATGGQFKMSLTSVTPDIWGRDVQTLCARVNDGDGLCLPVMSTLKRCGWVETPTAQLFLQLTDENGQPWPWDPRVVLGNVYQRFQERGLTPVIAPELEFHLFKRQRGDQGQPCLPDSPINGTDNTGGQLYSLDLMREQAGLLMDMQNTCKGMGLPVEGLVKELSPGQFELNLHHVSDPLEAADNTQILKRVVKGIAAAHGLSASFMAKPAMNLEGNGFHTHVSLVNGDGENVLDDGSEQGSDMLRHALAGLKTTMADMFLVFAPHLNSYRRFGAGGHARGVANWGYENRYVSLRIPAGDHHARRIEHRVAGADANPYLVIAAILAGIQHGLDNPVDPGLPWDGPEAPAGDDSSQTLPGSWDEALERFSNSPLVAELLGSEFQLAYSEVKRAELNEFRNRFSPFEYDTYFTIA